MLFVVSSMVACVLKRTRTLDTPGAEYVFPATDRVLDAEMQAMNAAEPWLAGRAARPVTA